MTNEQLIKKMKEDMNMRNNEKRLEKQRKKKKNSIFTIK